MFIRLLHFPVFSLGPGTRVGIWLEGCSLRCPGCVSQEFWEFTDGGAFPLGDAVRMTADFFLGPQHPDGLTISGGEPFDQPEALLEFLRRLMGSGVEDILIYSGYSARVLTARHPDLPELASALVDGPFEAGNRTDSAWKGSDNQSLTLWNRKFTPRYEDWMRTKNRRLQRVRSGNSCFLVGIPRQEDVGRLKNSCL
ncbi:MAG: radical SAM protein [Synergistaceae bacterium]|jgi:anaerobic ribonucleoside-triphosphate reductase activating protein|nr:radical SAM protein [Synergistaceae bacterium]